MDAVINGPILPIILDYVTASSIEDAGYHKHLTWRLACVCRRFRAVSQEIQEKRPLRLRVQQALAKQGGISYPLFSRILVQKVQFIGVSSFAEAKKTLPRCSSENRFYLTDEGQIIRFSCPEGTYLSQLATEQQIRDLLNAKSL